MTKVQQVCVRCVMDTTDPEIEFDEEGLCNHCKEFIRQRDLIRNDTQRDAKLNQVVDEMKALGKNRQYDCIIGVSGGTDSTYVAYIVKKMGLRPLAVHVDNGWNSELAVSNIEKTLKKLDIDLFTYVIDWEEFRDLQVSFLKASVPDAEMPTDHAIRAVLYQVAARHGIRYIINGRNFNTEGLLPWSWSYSAMDWRYLKNIQKRFGKQKIKNFPHFSLFGLNYNVMFRRVKLFSILNYTPYNKKDTMRVLQDELGWRDYGGKHYESIYTRFYQGYILPKKFDIDKRKAHLSSLICAGEIVREDALEELNKPTYSGKMMDDDKEYVLKKLDLTEDAFEQIMVSQAKTYADYKNNAFFFLLHKNRMLLIVVRLMKKLGLLPKGFADYATA